ncbi:MAG: alanine racemase [Treponema sp.]|jgi:alanine racemase|nr:alanine racemase [Treponema sp.]
MRCTKAVIFMKNLQNNISVIRSCIKPATKLCIAVKADAYGHGAVAVATAAVKSGADYLAVATVDEGIELRAGGITCPILMLSLCSPAEIPAVINYTITPFVFDEEYISLYETAARKKGISRFKVFLAVDTGMSRIGCSPEEARSMAEYIQRCPHLKLCGMATHFAVSDSTAAENLKFTEQQFNSFKKAAAFVREAGIDPGILTCSNSAAILLHPEMQLDMVRAGIITYGYYPDQVTENYLREQGVTAPLKPVMALETEVAAVRTLSKGCSVSYGRTWSAAENTTLAVLPLGYADGLLRKYSPGLKISIQGKLYPVRGRICMDQCMVETGSCPQISRWDKAVVFGPAESGALSTADDIAAAAETISYEVLTSISKRVPRVYRD